MQGRRTNDFEYNLKRRRQAMHKDTYASINEEFVQEQGQEQHI